MSLFKVEKKANYLLYQAETNQTITSNCVYFPEQKVLVDPGNPVVTPDLMVKMGESGVDPCEVETILCTHLHIDHIGAYWLFPKARIFAPDEEIECFLTDNRYFIVDYRIHNTKIKESLLKALELLTSQPYEKDLIPMSKILRKFNYHKELTCGQNGFLVFPSHTPGSAIIIYNKTVVLGDIFSIDKSLEWVPKTFQEKIKILHTIKAFGKKNIVSGHSQDTSTIGGEKRATRKNRIIPSKVRKAKKNGVYIHNNFNKTGNIISEYYFDKLGNRTYHHEGYYETKFSYNQLGKVHREIYYNDNGVNIADRDGRYGAQYNYNSNGQWVLLTELDQSLRLRKNNVNDYYSSVYYYPSIHSNKILARVDFSHRRIKRIKYLVDDYMVDKNEAFERYQELIYLLEKGKLF